METEASKGTYNDIGAQTEAHKDRVYTQKNKQRERGGDRDRETQQDRTLIAAPATAA